MIARRTRTAVLAGVTAAVVAAAAGGVAVALWTSADRVDTGSAPIGGVTFSAQSAADDTTRVRSAGGEAVSVILPGAVVAEVLAPGAVGQTVFWRFRADGAAAGITGLDYSVAVASQTFASSDHDLSDGVAQAGTVLAGSTLKVYRAAAGGDCSAVPATPPGDERNVIAVGADDVVLQSAGSNADASELGQEWCAAITWNELPDGAYANGATATATAEDGRQSTAIARWDAAVRHLPSLGLVGTYRNGAVAEGIAEDGSTSRAETAWHADVYPDGSGEPDVVISLDPVVTNLHPGIAPRD